MILVNRAGSVTEMKLVSVPDGDFQPAFRDPGWKNRDLGNRASPLSHMNTSRFFLKGSRDVPRSRKPGTYEEALRDLTQAC